MGESVFATKKIGHFLTLRVGDEIEDHAFDGGRKVESVSFDTETEFLTLWMGSHEYEKFDVLKESYAGAGWTVDRS
jgi:hypothetical protein